MARLFPGGKMYAGALPEPRLRSTPPSKPRRRFWPWVAAGLAGLGLTLYLSGVPKVEAPETPTTRIESVSPAQRFEQTRQLSRQFDLQPHPYFLNKGFTKQEGVMLTAFLNNPDRWMGRIAEHNPYRNLVERAAQRHGLDALEKAALYNLIRCENEGFDAKLLNKNRDGSTDYGLTQVNDQWWKGELLRKHYLNGRKIQWDPPGSRYGQGDVVAEKDRVDPEINIDAAAFIIKLKSAQVPKNLNPVERFLKIGQLYAGTGNKVRKADMTKWAYLDLFGKSVLRKELQNGLGTK